MIEVAFDYLAAGIDPALTTVCVQSALPAALTEMTTLYMNFVTVARLERNPTIKTEIQLRGFVASNATCRPDFFAIPFRKQPTLLHSKLLLFP